MQRSLVLLITLFITPSSLLGSLEKKNNKELKQNAEPFLIKICLLGKKLDVLHDFMDTVIRSNNIQRVENLLQQHQEIPHHIPLLHKARTVAMAEVLLRYEKNKHLNDNPSCLLSAMEDDRDPELVPFFLNQGANVHAFMTGSFAHKGRTALLHLVARRKPMNLENTIKKAICLMHAGADLASEINNPSSPYHHFTVPLIIKKHIEFQKNVEMKEHLEAPQGLEKNASPHLYQKIGIPISGCHYQKLRDVFIQVSQERKRQTQLEIVAQLQTLFPIHLSNTISPTIQAYADQLTYQELEERPYPLSTRNFPGLFNDY